MLEGITSHILSRTYYPSMEFSLDEEVFECFELLASSIHGIQAILLAFVLPEL